MRPVRPRDALGRPLAHGADGVEPEPEVVLPPAATLARAQLLLDTGRPFAAHEVLETAWKAAPPAERELWRGLAQLAVAVTHAARGNAAGAATLRARGAATIAPYAGLPASAVHGVDVDGLIAWAAATPGSAGVRLAL